MSNVDTIPLELSKIHRINLLTANNSYIDFGRLRVKSHQNDDTRLIHGVQEVVQEVTVIQEVLVALTCLHPVKLVTS